MAEEERLSGVKHTREYPAAAVEWLLSDAGISEADIDVVACNFSGHRYLAGMASTPAHLMRSATRARTLPGPPASPSSTTGSGSGCKD
jgi:carbamoyltransferase